MNKLILLLSVLFAGQSLLGQGVDPVNYLSTPVVAGTSYSLDKSNKAPGAIGGTININPTGAATYQIPILVSPGTGGIQPNLSLVYNSQSGNSLLGYKWGLAGLSAITRINKNPYNDGMGGSVTLTSSDALVLDGARLISTGTNTYAPEHDPYASVIFSGTGFTLTTQDGTVMEYGNTVDSRTVMIGNSATAVWGINKVTDANGNYMTFEYLRDSNTGETRINKINYTGNANAGKAPYSYVQFVYGKRTDENSTYMAGAQLTQNVLLTGIKVYCEGALSKDYSLQYFKDDGLYSKLNQVSLTADGISYNPTIINWGAQSSYTPTITGMGSLMGTLFENKVYFGDLNGDGRKDIIRWNCLYGTTNVINVSIANGDGSYSTSVLNLPATRQSSTTSSDYLTTVTLNEANTALDISILDRDNDGKDEIIVHYSDKKTKRIEVVYPPNTAYYYSFSDNLDSYKYNGATFDCTLLNSYDKWYNTPQNSGDTYKYYYGDFNNDGSIDRLETKNGSLFNCIGISMTSIPNVQANNVQLMDYDGDGQTEFLALTIDGKGTIYKYSGSKFVDLYENVTNKRTYWGGEGIVYTPGDIFPNRFYPNPFYSADFNGDGKTDILRLNDQTGNWEALYSKGAVTTNSDFTVVISPVRALNITTTIVDDINNDNKSDFISLGSDTVRVYLSNGNNFVALPPIETRFVNCTDLIKEYFLRSIDLDGDGQKELYYGTMNPDSVSTEITFWGDFTPTKRNFKKITFVTSPDQNLYVSSITNGNNVKSDITYTCPATYQSGTRNYPVIPIKEPIRLATNIVTTDRNTNRTLSNSTVTYTDGYIHTRGRGFMGFTTVKSVDAITQLSKVSNYNFTLSGATGVYYTWANSEVNYKADKVIANNCYTQGYYGGDVTKKFFLPVTTSSSATGLNGLTTTQSVVSFDTNTGRISEKKTTTSDGWTIDTQNSYTKLTGCISRLTQQTVTRTLGADTYTRITVNSYNGTNPLLVSSSVLQGKVTTNYQYDNFGNITQQSTVTNDGTRSVSYAYDGYGRFKTSATDALGYISYVTTRSCDGAKLSEKDINGLVTSYSYTPQANSMISKVTYPDGNKLTVTTRWDQSGTALYAVQKDLSQGKSVTEYYNATGNKLQEVAYGYKNATLTTTNTYNPDGTQNTVLNPGYSVPVTYAYQSDGRLQSVTGPNVNNSFTYSGNVTTTTDNISGVTKSQTTDALGNITSVSGTTGQVAYQYFASGKVKQITAAGATTTMTYDNMGNQLTLSDPDAGQTTYTYNGFGELLTQKDAKGQTLTNVYDAGGRLNSTSGPGTSTSYSYYTAQPKLGLLQTVTRDGVSRTLDYDGLERQISQSVTGAGKTYNTAMQYNSYGQVLQVTYPTGLSVEYGYDTHGNLTQINNAADHSLIWSGDTKNDRDQWTKYSEGPVLSTTWGYDGNARLSSILTGTAAAPASIQNLGFTFNTQGQLTNRTDGALSEGFTYDNQDRLTGSIVGNITQEYSYLDNGNINSTTLAGTYQYGQAPHQVANVSGVSSSGGSVTLSTTSTYTSDNKIFNIDNGTYKDLFAYGPDGNRFKVDFYKNSALSYSKVYDNNSEFLYDNNGNYLCGRTLIYAPTGICAVYQDSASSRNFYYIHTDYQGSWLAITDNTGSLKNRYSYDAWGRPRDPNTWALKQIGITNALANLNGMQPRFDRGYTGHELMAGFGLINMNGRLYDPYLQRFLSPDIVVQDPDNPQNYNRYSYCLNNPLRYVDPTGYISGSYDLREVVVEAVNLQLINQINSIIAGLTANMIAESYAQTMMQQGYFTCIINNRVLVYSDAAMTNNMASLNSGFINEVVVIGHKKEKVEESEEGDGDIGADLSYVIKGVSFVQGSASTFNTYQSKYAKYNEIWHETKTNGVSNVFQDKWRNPGSKYWRAQQIKPLEEIRNVGTKINKIGGVLLVADIAMSGKIRPSHWINGAMLGASTTGVGSLVAAGWFAADYGTLGINYLLGNGAVGLGDMIDNSDWGKSETYEMYEGVY